VCAEISGRSDDELAGLRNTEWAGAVFADYWLAVQGNLTLHQRLLKLSVDGRTGRNVEGLLLPGTIAYRGSPLRKSLIEVAPWNRHGVFERRYRGVGTALVAHLAAMSYELGGRGRLLITSTPGAIGFYEELGCRRLQYLRTDYILETIQADLLIKRTRWPEQ
jgi:hypothetical protein